MLLGPNNIKGGSMKTAIIIGASSGIGMELARILSKNNYRLGIAARRIDKLIELKEELSTEALCCQMDIKDNEKAMSSMKSLIKELGKIDLFIITSGIGYINKNLEWRWEEETIDVNVKGVVSIINVIMEELNQRGEGQLAVITSIASMRGSSEGPAYNASKAFLSNYLEGLRAMVHKSKSRVIITDIKPGLVDTAMAKGEGLFWVMSLKKTAQQIFKAIIKKKKVALVTKRWKLLSMVYRILPDRFL